jgi:formate dehydrogenase major subunit
VWWDAAAGEWTGEDVPDFPLRKAPDHVPAAGARAEDAHRGDDPFVMQPDGLGWLFVPNGVVDGPLPAHYEPHESPVANGLYGRNANPARQLSRRRENPYNEDAAAYPYVVTTYRLTEHHAAGGMSRFVAYLSELQPELFCEVSPELARERGLVHGDWATVVTARAAVEARVLVSRRMRPLVVQGRTLHQVGLPYHWGWRGISTGDTVNDLFPLALDPNVHIQEVKAATCDIRPGRRARP